MSLSPFDPAEQMAERTARQAVTPAATGVDKEINLNAIIETFDGFVWSVNSNLEYIILNSAVRKKVKQLLGIDIRPGDKMLDILELLDPSKTPEWKKLYQRGFEGIQQKVIQRFVLENEVVYFDIAVNPIVENDIVIGFSCFVRDVTEKVQNEEKLRSSETWFRALIENNRDFIIVLTPTGDITYASPSVQRHSPVENMSLQGLNAFQFLYEEDIPPLQEKLQQLLNNPTVPLHIQVRARTMQGTEIWLEGIITNMIDTPGVNGIVCNVRDISDRKRAEDTLQQSELKFRSLIEHCDDFIMMADSLGNFTYGSPSVTKYLGYAEEDYINKTVFNFIHPDSVASAQKLLQGLFENPGKPFLIDLQLLHKNGTSVWVEGIASNMFDVEGVNALVGNYRDITARKLAEQKAKESEDLYKNLFNKSPLPVWVCDAASLRFLEANESAVIHYGFSHEEFLEMTAEDIMHPQDHSELRRFLATDNETTPRRLLRKHIKKNKESIFVEILAHAISYKGKPSFLVLANDFTEKVRLQHELMEEKTHRHREVTRASIDAQEKEREEIGRELHDNVKQMLSTVKLSLSCITVQDPVHAQMLQRSSDIITDAITEIRKLSRSLTYSFQKEIGLQLSIEDLLNSIRITDKIKIAFAFELEHEKQLDDKLKICIFRIIQEQLANVLQHAEASKVSITIAENDNTLELKIVDNGKGFDPKNKRNGIGITNIISRAELFNGNVDIKSAPGKGCTLKVTFPLNK
ncbi:MAG: PAS domain S-box protein [Chitinophagaceae bacterium]